MLCLAVVLLLGVGQLMPQAGPNPPSAPAQTAPGAPSTFDPEKPMHIGGNVKPPLLIYSKDPEFSEQARGEHVGGSIEVYLWVGVDGHPSHVRVVKGVGYGLDEKAVEAVKSYRFRPATKNGVPVLTDMYVEVNFVIRDK